MTDEQRKRIHGIEQLHKEIQVLDENNIDTYELVRIADAIEREVEEGYIELPKDKNGVPIRLGDRVCSAYGGTYEVARVTREDYNGTTTWYIEDFSSNYSLGPEDLTHHKPPTVEDVLEDYRVKYYDLVTDMECKNITNEEYVQGINELASEYAAKLQIRGE